MKNTYLVSGLLLLFSHAILANPHDSESNWEIIHVEPEFTVTDNEGNLLTIEPACAFDTITNPEDGTTIDNSFHFYFKPGIEDKLIVYFNGGGACWDDATCVTSLAVGGRPTYNPTVHQANSPLGAGGIFDNENKNNPFKGWSKVFIPYCTGDLHVGSNTVTYHDIDGSLTGFPGYPGAPVPIQVKHHGFDNFLAVRSWIKEHFSTQGVGNPKIFKDLVVTGSSAGGYGATFNFPYLQDDFPGTNAVLFADASEAIVTQGFIDGVFSVGSNWNIEHTLPTIFADELGSFTEEALNAEIFTILTTEYPNNRFAQYTTAYDSVQIAFFKIMDKLDNGITDPLEWGLTGADFAEYFVPWNSGMESSLEYIASMTANYQYYIGDGSVHSILTDAFATGPDHHPFYDENSAEGVLFTDWIDRFVNDQNFNEENLKHSN